MEPGVFIKVFFISMAGGFIQRVCGFGFGIFVMLFFPYFIKPHTSAAAISTLVSCFTSGYNAFLYRKKVPYKRIIPLIIGAIVMIPIAVRFSVMISGDFFKKLLGVILILLSIYFLVFNQKLKIRPTFVNGILAGGLGGVLSGLFSTGGPPIVLYLMNSLSDNITYFASTQFYFFGTGMYSTLMRAFNGVITKEVIICTAIGFLGSIVGNFAGKYTFDKLNQNMLKRIVYIGMLVSGFIMLI